MSYLVKLDVKLEKIEDNKSEVQKGAHGVLDAVEEEYTFRSRYPFIAAWITDLTIEQINNARYALVTVKEAKLKTQLTHPRDGEVYTVVKVFGRKPSNSSPDLDGVQTILLSNLLAGAPQHQVLEKVYSRNVGARLKSEAQYEYLEKLGKGNASEGLRRLISWAIENQPDITKKITQR